MNRIVPLFALVLGLLQPAVGSADVITFHDRELFEAQGVIAFNSNFNDFGTGLTFPPCPLCNFTRGDVTYHGQTFWFGPDTVWTDTAETLLGDVDYGLVFADIATGPQYDMFGFDVGVYGPGPVDMRVSTNLATYLYPNLTLARSDLGDLEFWGLVANGGEFLTRVTIRPGANPNYPEPGFLPGHPIPGVTNVAVGHVTPVPEPATLLLLGSGLVGLGLRRYRVSAQHRRKVTTHMT